jgi:undecaprenyl-diphosphatase
VSPHIVAGQGGLDSTPDWSIMATPPLLARQRLVAAIIAVAAIGTAVLGFRYAGQRRPGRIDRAVDTRLEHRLQGHLRFLHHLVAIGDPASIVVLSAVLAAVFFFSGRRRVAALAVLGPAVAAGFTEFVLKPLIGRRLQDNLSFPSGHTTAAVSLAVVIVIALLGPSRPRWPSTVRWSASGLALLGAASVATALVGSGYHYATDTLGGFCVAVAVVPGVAWVLDALYVGSEHESSRPHGTRQPV